MTLRARSLQVLTVAATAIVLAVPSASAQSPATAPVLGTAAGYSVLAGSTVTNTGPSVLGGELGVSPGSAITGFPPGLAAGARHTADAQSAQAQSDLTIAYNDAASAKTTATIPDVGNIGGRTLTAGVYTSASSMMLTGTVTLDGGGNPNAVFIFQTGSTVVTASSSRVLLENGAQACNVYWQIGSSATLGTGSSFVGTLMALTSATVTTGVTVDGRVLARNGAVTLDSDTFQPTSCTTTVTPQTVVSPTTTTTSTHTTGSSTSTVTTTTTKAVKPATVSLPTSGCGCGSTIIGSAGGSTTGARTGYKIIAVSRHARVTIDQATGKLTFKVSKGAYGVFTCDVQYGNKVIVVHYTVKKSKTAPAACVA